MVLVTNINRPPYKYPKTCDWSRNLEKKFKDFNMKWNTNCKK
jgi:hypothetical protein